MSARRSDATASSRVILADKLSALRSLLQLSFQILHFALHQLHQSMMHQINLDDIHPELARDFRRRPMPDRIKIKYLKMLRLRVAADPLERRFKQIFAPFAFPCGIKDGGV